MVKRSFFCSSLSLLLLLVRALALCLSQFSFSISIFSHGILSVSFVSICFNPRRLFSHVGTLCECVFTLRGLLFCHCHRNAQTHTHSPEKEIASKLIPSHIFTNVNDADFWWSHRTLLSLRCDLIYLYTFSSLKKREKSFRNVSRAATKNDEEKELVYARLWLARLFEQKFDFVPLICVHCVYCSVAAWKFPLFINRNLTFLLSSANAEWQCRLRTGGREIINGEEEKKKLHRKVSDENETSEDCHLPSDKKKHSCVFAASK